MRRKANKYKAKKCKIDGYTFDSLMEGRRYSKLKLLERVGEIKDLEVHPAYPIVWPGTDTKICVVELDFRYKKNSYPYPWLEVAEDVKGCKTALSSLKKKLVEAMYEITVTLITKVQ